MAHDNLFHVGRLKLAQPSRLTREFSSSAQKNPGH
jgi:hypothetical protein